MNPSRSSRRPFGLMLLLGVALLSGGCAGALGPEPMPVTRVRGFVREGNRPISGGWIEFIPIGLTVGKLRSAPIGPDGSFDADGVAVGENGVRVVNERVEKTAFLGPFGRFTTPIRRIIPASPSSGLKIDLVQEALRYQEARQRGLPPTPPETEESP
jgi:hypothetical protein